MSDARMLGPVPRLQLDVTKEAIARAIERNSNHCMVAEALKDARPDFSYIAVDIQTIRATSLEKKERYVWLTPRSIQQFIVDFDSGKREKLKPFRTNLRVGQTMEAGNTDENNKRRKAKQAKLRKFRASNAAPPVPVGGKPPPRGVGQRRQFGLRALDY